VVHPEGHKENPAALIQAAAIDLTAIVGRAGLERNPLRVGASYPGPGSVAGLKTPGLTTGSGERT
jgi:hypothetical protein